jgi:hypothetical protein
MRALDREEPLSLPRASPLHAVVPIGAPDAAALRALGYARSVASRLTVLQLPGEDAALTRRRLRRLGAAAGAEFVELSSGRDPIEQVVSAIDAISADDRDHRVAVVLSGIVPRRPWLLPLHDQSLRLKLRLFAHPAVAVIDVPYHV